MIRTCLTLATASCLGALLARADIPSPSASFVDPCIVACPAGDSVFTVIGRHFTGDPFIAATATLRLCDCPGVRILPASEAGHTLLDECSPRIMTGPDGHADFGLEVAGVCSNADIRLDVDGVILAIRSSVACFDQDGDGTVDVHDLAIVDGTLGTIDPTADFGDGGVSLFDRTLLLAHVGHTDRVPLAVIPGAVLRLSATPAPNPGRGPVEFVLRTPVAGHAALSIHDLGGRRVKQVFEGDLPAGTHRAAWAGRDDAGKRTPPGVYFYRFAVGPDVARGLLVVER